MCSKPIISGRQKAPKPLVRIIYKLIKAIEILTAKIEFPSYRRPAAGREGRLRGIFEDGSEMLADHFWTGTLFLDVNQPGCYPSDLVEDDHHTRRDHDWGGQNWPGLRSFLRSRSRQKPSPQATFGRKKAAPPCKPAFEINRF